MFLITALVFMSHTQLLSAIWQAPSACFRWAASASTLLSPPRAEQALGAGGHKRKKKLQPRRGDDTSAEKSAQRDKDYVRGMCKNRGRCQPRCSEPGKISQRSWLCALRSTQNKRRAGYFVENVIQWKLPSVHREREE